MFRCGSVSRLPSRTSTPPDGEGGLFDSFGTFAILTLIGAFLGALVTLVARFLAGSWES